MRMLFRALFITAVFFIVSLEAFSDEPIVSFMVRGGINYSGISGKFDSKKNKLGYRGGVFMDYGPNRIFVRLGVGVTTKDFSVVKESVDYSANLLYAGGPVNVGVRIGLSENTKLIFLTGPYFSFGLKGKWTYAKTAKEEVREENAFSNTTFTKFDYGAVIETGIIYKSIEVDVGTHLGVANINQDFHQKAKSKSFHITLGYRF